MLGRTVIAFALLWGVEATPTGNHTCTGVVKHEVTVKVNVTEPVTFRAYEWCLRVPPRCSTYTIQLKDRVKIHKEMHNRTITVCCKGYMEIDYKCVPACPPDTECPNMHCNRTNHCYCTPGYTGLYCNHPCPKGVWGSGCIKPSNNESSHHIENHASAYHNNYYHHDYTTHDNNNDDDDNNDYNNNGETNYPSNHN
ncbi:hypothetical protein GE061_009927 [Apolygus lucorum]|uniref:EMI domain-containing protein n=1 Tax=Apolygus lucorum TaxID=248454 RepID=A0A8S9Y4B2_APOLU|nr:hypothetical protein GE061_009927 [Apolygus lucorum]